LSKFDLQSVCAAYKRVSFDPGYQLLNCLDCIESDSLLFTRIEKIFATSQRMFRYKEIVYIGIIFLAATADAIEMSSQQKQFYKKAENLQLFYGRAGAK
jgi:hypothetical protein